MNNGSTAGNRERIIERLSQTAVVRRSFLGEERIPDRAAPGRRPTHQIPPTKAQVRSALPPRWPIISVRRGMVWFGPGIILLDLETPAAVEARIKRTRR